ncbi:MAG: type II secretion system protein GspL [Rhodocyclaceae bacterium]
MSRRRLVVYLDETWPEQPSAPWVLLDDRDRSIEQGRSEPRHWPAAGDCEIVLSSPQCTWLETRLPAAGRAEQSRLLRYALEDQLLRDVDEQHLTLVARTAADEGVLASVLVCGRQRLRAVIAQFEALGRRPARVVSELQACAAPTDGWALSIGPTSVWTLHSPPSTALALDADAAPDILAHLLASARAADRAPARLRLLRADDAPAADQRALEAALEAALTSAAVRLERGPRYHWWAQRNTSADLLHDEFEPLGAGGGWTGRTRGPLLLASLAAFVWLAATLGEVVWHGQQLGATEERMRRIFETAVPNTPAIAPAVQLRRSLDEARAAHGQLRETDFLTLLDSFAEIGGATTRHAVTRLEYQDGSLSLQLDRARIGDPELLRARLATLGHDLAQGSEPGTYVLTRRTLP